MIWRARADVLWREEGGETILLDPRSGRYFGLTGIGPSVWKRLQSPVDIDGLVGALSEEFEAPADVLRRDLEAFLRELTDADLCHAPPR